MQQPSGTYLRAKGTGPRTPGNWTFFDDGHRIWLFTPFGRTATQWRHRQDSCSREELRQRVEAGGYSQPIPTDFEPGDFHARIWRGEESPTPEEAGYRTEWIASVNAARSIFSRLEETLYHFDPVSAASAHGNASRELMILACTEVETAFRAILTSNAYTPQTKKGKPREPKDWKRHDFVKLAAPLRLKEWKVRLSAYPTYPTIQPFEQWTPRDSAGSLQWYDDYNYVKHDRERNISKATLKNAIDACAALFILTIAQFGLDHLTGHVLHPDSFHIDESPQWDLSEQYIAPGRTINPEPNTTIQIGREGWTRISLAIRP